MMRRTAAFALTSLACAVVAHAQTTSGALRGTLRSQAGSPIANATVSVRDLANGSVRSTLSDANGNYQLPLLAVGTYQLTVTSAGSQTVQDSNVRIALGLTSVQNYTIASATGASATVEVTGRSQNLDSQQMFTSSSVDQSLIESIPLGGARDFTSLVNLTPGTVYDADSNRVSVEGARGIQNNLSIDGASYNSNFFGEQRGSTRIPFAFGADTIQELQIIRNSYDAQYGNASGAVINAISKSGTNTFSGSLLYQVRPKSLVAKIAPAPYDPTGATSLSSFRTKNFNQVQGNFNFGGPIIKDKLFFFVGTEQYSYTEDFSPTITPTSSTGSTLADTVTFLQNFGNMIVGPGTRTLSQDAGLTVDGSGNLVVTNTSKYTNDRLNRVYFGRLDYIINPDHRFTIRVNAQDWSSDNGTIAFTSSSAPRTGVSNQGLEKNSGLSWVAELSSILSPNLVNEARLQRAIERRPRFEKGTSPEFNAFTWTSGQLNYLPNGLDEFSWQFVDNLTYSKDNWTIKAGVDLQSFDFTNTFYRYQNGSFTFFNVGMANKWKTAPTTLTSTDSISYTGAFSDYGGAIAYASKLNSGYGQIQRQGLMDGKLTLNAGLRYVKEIQPNNPRPNAQFMGLDQANSSDALDPRAGFTYDLGGNGKTLVRGGYGHFSSPNPSLTVSNTMNSNGMTTS
ncbi:MAG: carboxypeptidase regulatory-like domain-containing protein, partial [Holophagaceae bacterium]